MNTLLELIIIVAPKDYGDKTINKLGGLINLPSVIRSRGTAPNSALAALGIGEPEKDMIFGFTEKKNVEKIYGILMNDLDFVQRHLGIAMTVPVSAVGGNLTLDILTGTKNQLTTHKRRGRKL